jgi:hydroxyacylglutathione hydrolase
MLNVSVFTFNAFQENTYLLANEQKQCWIIDPGMYEKRENEELIAFIDQNHLSPQAVINTHAHLDHIFGVKAMMDKYKIPFGLHHADQPLLNMATASASLYGFTLTDVPGPAFYIKEGEPLKLGNDEITVFHTPGHSPGSISLYYPQGGWVISGDVLFSGSIGRTDLPGGDFNTLISGIRNHLFTLPADTTVFSGHGPATTIGEEREHNPFLR